MVQLRYVCICLQDKGSEDIQVLPNGLAFITSVSYGGRLCWLLIIRCYAEFDEFSINTIVDNVENDDENSWVTFEGVVEKHS